MGARADGPLRGNVQLIKAINQSTVLKLVRDSGTLSRSDIARQSGLTMPTVSSILDSLVAQGVIQHVGLGASTGGRKPLLFQFNPHAGLLIGIDVGGTKMAGGLTNLAGDVLARERSATADGPPDPYERLLLLISKLLRHVPPGGVVRGIGLGVAGVINLAKGVVTLAPSLGWTDFPLGPQLERCYGLPVFLDNDVNAILLGERWSGVARDAENVLCVAIGTGIGASMLVGGQIYRGATEAAGEVGFFATDRQALQRPPTTRTSYGFLEYEAAGPGIARRGSRAVGRPVTTAELFRLAASGDPAAQAVVDETVQHLGVAIANMVCLLNPDMVILTGGVMRSADQLLGGIKQIIDHLVPYPPQIVLSELQDEAGVIGAAALVLEAPRRSISVEVGGMHT